MRQTGHMGSVSTTAMESPAPTGPTRDSHTDLETMVAEYLCGHPDFLSYHPDVLAKLHIPHTSAGTAVSLIEHQVRVLRTQLATERSRLSQLIARAREYEAFAARLHALVLALISARDLEQVRAVLHEALMSEFSAQAVTLKLFPMDPATTDGERDPTLVAFEDFLGRKHTLCGPLDEAKTAALFGTPGHSLRESVGRESVGPDSIGDESVGDEAGNPIHSAALVPIHAGWQSGVLAIGATDPNRFRPDMGTDFLDRLGEIVGHRLRMLPPEPAPQTTTPAPEPTPRPRRRRTKKASPE